MSKPRILDLFCGAGGAAMGYSRAGFDVIGVDIKPQPNYPFEFHQLDALAYKQWPTVDAIHASPPCQAYANVTSWRGDKASHPELIPPTRFLLEATDLPWVIENVPEAAIRRDFLLCGSMFGLRVKRHRVFETHRRVDEGQPSCGSHAGLLPFMHKGERAYADAMGCDWMTNREARQAIPPAYTEFIGRSLMAAVEENRKGTMPSDTHRTESGAPDMAA
jgi:hypothetical protein